MGDDIEELLLERGVVVSYESVRNGCDRFGAMYACQVKAARPRPGTTWHLDELFVKLRGKPYVLLQKRRDKTAARRFFGKRLR